MPGHLNATNRIASPKDPADIRDVFSSEDLPDFATAPDEETRRSLEAITYRVHKNFVWPLCKVPIATEAGQVLEIVAARAGIQILVDGDDVPLFWGRSTVTYILSGIKIIDVGNSNAGRSTRIFDMVASPGAEFVLRHAQILSPKFLGSVWNYETTVQDTLLKNAAAGISLRSTSLPGVSMYLRGARFVQPGGAAAMVKPMMAVAGGVTTFACYSGDHQPNVADRVLVISEGTTGEYDIIGNSLSTSGVASGQFMSKAANDTLTKMEAADITVSSVEDSVVAPGVDSAVVVDAYTGLRAGQNILLAGLGIPYDGMKTLTRVDPTERKLEFASVFAGTATGTIKITRFTTTANNDISEGEPVEVASVSYNLTEDALFVGDNTFDLPVAFVLDDAAGTADVARRDEKSIGINFKTNGNAKDSDSVGRCVVVANTTVTVLPGQNIWTDLKFGGAGLAVAGSDIERWEVADQVTGELRLLAPTFDGDGCAKISARSMGSAQRFQFRIVKMGAPMSDGIVATDELTSVVDHATVESPIVSGVAGDLYRVQTRNIDGNSDITVEEFLFTTSKH